MLVSCWSARCRLPDTCDIVWFTGSTIQDPKKFCRNIYRVLLSTVKTYAPQAAEEANDSHALLRQQDLTITTTCMASLQCIAAGQLTNVMSLHSNLAILPLIARCHM